MTLRYARPGFRRATACILAAFILLPCLASPVHAQVYRGFNEEPTGQDKEDGAKRKEVRVNYEGGALHYVVEYRRGKLDGLAKEYYDNGVLKAEVRFKDNFRDGVARYYHPDGMLRARILFNHGTEVGKSQYYDSSGAMSRETNVSSKVRSIVESLADTASTAPKARGRTRERQAADSSGK